MVTIQDDGSAEFRFYRPKATSVALVGDFTKWQAHVLKMVREKDGYWVLRLTLPAGQYKFRYLADGAWYTDFAAFGVEPGRFGMDSILDVPERALKLDPAGAGGSAAAEAVAA